MPVQVTGTPAAALELHLAFNGQRPSNPIYSNLLGVAGATSVLELARVVGRQFAHVPDAELTQQVLVNLGVTTSTIPFATLSTLVQAMAQAFAAYPTERGIVVLNAAHLLTQLEGDRLFTTVAKTFNQAVTDAYVYATNSIGIGGIVPGTIYRGVLTTLPTDALGGSERDDVFNGNLFFSGETQRFTQTLNSGDAIDGAAGNDTLQAGFNNTTPQALRPLLSNIEALKVNATGTSTTTLDLSASSGLREVTVVNGAAGGHIVLDALATTLTNVTLEATRAGLVVHNTAAAIAGTTDSVTVMLRSLVEPVSLGLTGYEAINLSSGVSAPTTPQRNALSLTASSGVTIAASGAVGLQLSLAVAGGAAQVDASAMTGLASLQLGTSDALELSVTGTAAGDTVDFGPTYDATDRYDGGLGVDTITMAQALAANLTRPQSQLSNLEVLALADAVAAARYTPAAFGGATAFTTSAIASTASFAVDYGSGRSGLTIKADHTGTAIVATAAGAARDDVLDLTLGRDDHRLLQLGAAGGAVVTHGFEILNISSTSAYGNSILGGLRMQTVQGPTLLAITGESELQVYGPVRADRIDASAHSGGLRMYAAPELATRIIGSPSNDTFSIHQGDTVTGGLGIDIFMVGRDTHYARITDHVVGRDVLSVEIAEPVRFEAPRTLAEASTLDAVRAGVRSTDPTAFVLSVTAGAAAGTYLYVAGQTDLLLEITGINGSLNSGAVSFYPP